MSARTGGLILAPARDGPHARRRPRRPTACSTRRRARPGSTRGSRTCAARGVALRGGCEVAGIDCDGRRITGVTVQTAAGPEPVTADHYVAALPVERLRLLVSPELRAAEPRLGALPRLVVRWMNGAMFYLDRDVPLQHGHAIFIDSEWALTAISQAQFWPGRRPRAARRRARRGDPLRRHLRVGAPGAAHRQGRDGVHAGGDPRGGVGPADRPHRRRLARRGERPDLVPRSRDPVPQPDRGDEPRAAADQHGGLVGGPARTPRRGSRTCSSPPTSCARTPTSRRWRARTRRRGARSTAILAATGSRARPLPRLDAARAAAARAVPRARRAALEARPPAGAAAAARDRDGAVEPAGAVARGLLAVARRVT